jgi:lipopolysaccharide transport system permease protein
MSVIKELYAYREMIFSLVKRDLKGRYKGSILGFAWTFLNPLLQLAVYTLVFSIIMRSGIKDYYNYLFVALVPWIFFSSCISAGAGCIRMQGDMIKKIYFPREVIPVSFVTSQFVNMLLSFLVVFVVLFFAGKSFNPRAWLVLPLVMIVEYFLALGMTMIISGVTVYWRDVEYFMGIIALAWQFATPVMYGMDMIPDYLIPFFNINPMTSIIVAYRDILYYGKVPEIETILRAAILAVCILVIGELLFSHFKRHFAEEL